MKVVTVLGSPKRNGKTALALGFLEEALVSMGHEVENIAVVDHRIGGCAGCLACHKARDVPGCVIEDDAVQILDRLVGADAVVYASPLYGFDVSSQLKALFDRHNSICKWSQPNPPSLFEGKRVALLVTSGGPEENNTEHAQGIFDLMFGRTLRANVIGKYIVPFSFKPGFEAEAKIVAGRIAKEITA